MPKARKLRAGLFSSGEGPVTRISQGATRSGAPGLHWRLAGLRKTAPARGAYLLAVLAGSYGLVWTLTAGAAVLLSRLGLERSEAVIASSLLGFVLYPTVALALFAAHRPLRAWGLVAGLGAMLLLARHLPGAN